MTETNGTPQIIIDVKFDVARKGYDPSQVDAYLERVGIAVAQMQEKLRSATAQLETADARIAEAARARAAAEARLAEIEAQVAAAPVTPESLTPEAEIELSAGVLAMAQRTADAAVNDARTNAAALLASAEAEAAAIVGDAKRRAEGSIADLESRRLALAADNDALSAFMDEQRAFLAADVARIQAVLDDPRALRVSSLPEPSAASIAPEPEVVAPSSDLPTMATPVVQVEAVEAEVEEPAGSEESAGATPLFGEDDAADEAMRKFFDADFDDDDRFGR